MLPHSNRRNHSSTAQNDAQVWLRGAAGAKQAHLCAVFVPASPRLRNAASHHRWHSGSVPHGAPLLTLEMHLPFWRAARFATACWERMPTSRSIAAA